MSDDYPYRVEYAKTGRAGCKKCKVKIDQGILRVAAMVQVRIIGINNKQIVIIS